VLETKARVLFALKFTVRFFSTEGSPKSPLEITKGHFLEVVKKVIHSWKIFLY